MKTFIIILMIGGGLLAGVWFFSQNQSPAATSAVISRNGLHWHANLSIKILGEAQNIPAGIGLEKLPHKPIHTHDSDSVMHLEFSGLVKQDDLKLGQFFKVWGKQFNRDCIFDRCAGNGHQLKMLVNGKENVEFENYIMQDNDKIEIIFE